MRPVEPTPSAVRQARSYLYVPADQERLLANALDRGADALVLDLEDAVHPDRKEAARTNIAAWLADLDGSRHVPLWLRVNATTTDADLLAVRGPIAGVMLPAAQLTAVERLVPALQAAERRLGLDPDGLGVIALIETARGLLDAPGLAAHPRVRHLAIGRADLAGELGLSVDPDGPEFRALMLPLVVASSAAGIAAPIAPTSTDYRDLAGLRETTATLAALGFRGRTAIHPAQVPVINEVFTPDEETVRHARRTLALFQEALDRGEGIAVGDDGRMIDAAVVRQARSVLARAGR
jgi:citrate lyase subunit beta/citryl-CoA lyase